jgi:hypothetical protein
VFTARRRGSAARSSTSTDTGSESSQRSKRGEWCGCTARPSPRRGSRRRSSTPARGQELAEVLGGHGAHRGSVRTRSSPTTSAAARRTSLRHRRVVDGGRGVLVVAEGVLGAHRRADAADHRLHAARQLLSTGARRRAPCPQRRPLGDHVERLAGVEGATVTTAESSGETLRATMLCSATTTGCRPAPRPPSRAGSRRDRRRPSTVDLELRGPPSAGRAPPHRARSAAPSRRAARAPRPPRPAPPPPPSAAPRRPPPPPAGRRSAPSPPTARAVRASRSATASPIATCASCPQACITPAWVETKSCVHSSWIGSASMSARSSSVGPSPAPPRSVPTTPVTATPVRTSYPAARSRSATIPAVRNSWKPSSGCRCRSRRVAISSSRSVFSQVLATRMFGLNAWELSAIGIGHDGRCAGRGRSF